MARQRDYKAEYRKRVEKARKEGYSGYGQKRHRLQKMEKLRTELQQQRSAMMESLGGGNTGDAVVFSDIPPSRMRKIEEAKQWGASQKDLQDLYDMAGEHDSDFWRSWREMYDRVAG